MPLILSPRRYFWLPRACWLLLPRNFRWDGAIPLLRLELLILHSFPHAWPTSIYSIPFQEAQVMRPRLDSTSNRSYHSPRTFSPTVRTNANGLAIVACAPMRIGYCTITWIATWPELSFRPSSTGTLLCRHQLSSRPGS